VKKTKDHSNELPSVAESRRQASSKPSTVQIYITAGALGRHAGVYSHDRCWAAHPTDDATAAWRAAVKFWFGKGTNAAWRFDNVRRVAVVKNTDLTWQAYLAPAGQPVKLPEVIEALREVRSQVAKQTGRVASKKKK
jgi:hypothetical protein